MKIFILLGHPDSDGTLTSELASIYQKNASDAGHEVRRLNIGELTFDPILHEGYQKIQELEPDLLTVQENIRWCDHFVLVYPLWWSDGPALLKGMIDRMWLPGFAFRFIKNAQFKMTVGWQKLLKGKSARVIVTLKNYAFMERFMFGNYTASMVDAVLRFSGFKVFLTEIGNAEDLSDKAKAAWFAKVALLGKRGK